MKTGNLSNDDGNGGKNVTQKWIRTVSNFIAFIPAPLICQMLAIFQELNSKGLYLSSLKQKENCCLVFTSSKNVKFTSLSCSDGKEMYKKTWYTCKVVVLLGTVGWRISGHVHTEVHTVPQTFCARAKIIRIWPLLTHENGCGGTISATKRSCAAPISKVERHTSERFCAKLWCSINRYSDWFASVFEGLLYVEDFTTNRFSRTWRYMEFICTCSCRRTRGSSQLKN